MGKNNIRITKDTMILVLGAFKQIFWHIVRTIAILLVLIGLAIAIPTLIAADSLSEWINEQ